MPNFAGYPAAGGKTAAAVVAVNDHPDHHNVLATAVNNLQDQINAGRVLARVDYNPAAFATPAVPATNTWTTVDATNLAVTFTAPAAGKVRLRLVCLAVATTSLFWRVAEGGAGVAASEALVTQVTGAYARWTHDVVVSGVTAGSHTWVWQARNTSTTAAANLLYGTAAPDNYGPAVIEVTAA